MRRKPLNGGANPDFSMERKPKLLLVDENPQDLHDYTAMLRHLGYEVKPAGSYTGAVEFLDREAFDLVMVDQGSTDFEGRAVLRRAVEIDHRTPVLVLTGTVSASCCVNALDMGADEYVQKPLTSSEVRELVDDYLRPSIKPAAAGRDLLIHTQGANRESLHKAS
jgi:DNA-binding response OmpR family regulator